MITSTAQSDRVRLCRDRTQDSIRMAEGQDGEEPDGESGRATSAAQFAESAPNCCSWRCCCTFLCCCGAFQSTGSEPPGATRGGPRRAEDKRSEEWCDLYLKSATELVEIVDELEKSAVRHACPLPDRWTFCRCRLLETRAPTPSVSSSPDATGYTVGAAAARSAGGD